MGLLPDIDKEKTKEQVDSLLSQYRSFVRYARDQFEPKITVTYHLEMTSQTNVIHNPIEDAIVLQTTAEEELCAINKAYNKLGTEKRRRLYDKYMRRTELTNLQLAEKYIESTSTFYRELGKAQYEFAEAYCGGSLMIFK
ncbi:ArpU family phage packaging/lysis transcriptional regulator [Ligilactobacillus acidipiscis]|uniref:ArpU family transcriptional regulator n=1 Tax=Ligilactobacillus acidipiscis TaxID=89059 RepID=A0A0R2KNZ4_9LACO|nr:ArpU family phage packaging/lysis transcriptional regulator [Ligilactobacillus acidipiscis]KRN88183.1 hypothetical protein IV43_GL000034 [Ligilactobacillus acidipiscis]